MKRIQNSPFAGTDLKSLGLSGQEEQVIRLSTTGLGDKEIAVEMAISVDTVRTYWQRIRRKAGGSTRSEIVARIVRRGVDVQIQEREEQNSALQQEIAKRMVTETELRRSEQVFRAMSDSSPLGIFVADEHGNCSYVNGRYSQISGLTADQCMGSGWENAVHPEDRSVIFLRWQEAVFAERDFISNHRMVKPDGELVHVRVCASAFSSGLGLGGFVGSVEDVTEFLVSQERLIEAEKLSTRVNATLPDILYIYDTVEQKNVSVNRNMAEILGYSAEEIYDLGDQLFPKLIHPEDLDRVFANQLVLRDMADKAVLETEYRMMRKDGEWRWLLSRDVVFRRNAQGKCVQSLGIAADITERKKSIAALRDYAAILENEMDGIAVLDENGFYLQCNLAFAELANQTPEQLVGKNWRDEMPGHAHADRLEQEKTVKQLGRVEYEVCEESEDGSVYVIRTLLVAVASADGAFRGYYCFKRDISASVALSREVKILRERLDRLVINEAILS